MAITPTDNPPDKAAEQSMEDFLKSQQLAEAVFEINEKIKAAAAGLVAHQVSHNGRTPTKPTPVVATFVATTLDSPEQLNAELTAENNEVAELDADDAQDASVDDASMDAGVDANGNFVPSSGPRPKTTTRRTGRRGGRC